MTTKLDQFISKRPPIRLVAGGIIFNETLTEILIVKGGKSRKWGLPKGGIKKKESYMAASLREIREETGIKIRLMAETLPFVCIDQAKLYIYVLPKMMCHLNPEDKDEIIDIKWISIQDLARLGGKTKLLSTVERSLKHYVERVKQNKKIYQPLIIGYGGNKFAGYDLFGKNNVIELHQTGSTPPKVEFILNKYLADKIMEYVRTNYNVNKIREMIMDEFPQLLNAGDICLTATNFIERARKAQESWRILTPNSKPNSNSNSKPNLQVSPGLLMRNRNLTTSISV